MMPMLPRDVVVEALVKGKGDLRAEAGSEAERIAEVVLKSAGTFLLLFREMRRKEGTLATGGVVARFGGRAFEQAPPSPPLNLVSRRTHPLLGRGEAEADAEVCVDRRVARHGRRAPGAAPVFDSCGMAGGHKPPEGGAHLRCIYTFASANVLTESLPY